MHRIFHDQNQEKFLELLFLQRKCYSIAKRDRMISWGMVASGVIIVLISYFFKETKCLWQFGFVMSWLSLFFDGQYKKYIRIASASQAYIDDMLFGFEVKSEYHGFRKAEIYSITQKFKEKYRQSFKLQTQNTGTDSPPGVLDWYTATECEEDNEVIFSCQKQNFWWNHELSEEYVKKIAVFIGILAAAAIGINVYFNLRIQELGFILAKTCAILKQSWIVYQEYKSDDKLKSQTDGMIRIIEKRSIAEEDLIQLQASINAIRETGFHVPDFVHKREAGRLHRLSRRILKRLEE